MRERRLGFELRVIHNLTRSYIGNHSPKGENAPQTQLQAGIMAYLFRHQDQPVYQKHLEEEFSVSRATATNTLQCMEKNHLILRSCMDKDGRLKRIMMTEEAMKNHAVVEQHMDEMDQMMREGLSPQEQQELFRLLDRVRDNLEHMTETKNGEERQTC